jgi:hypothetical protein
MNNSLTTRPATLVEIRSDATRFPRLTFYDPAVLGHALQGIVAQACTLRGQAVTDDSVAFIASTLAEDLLRDEPGIGLCYLTLEEIRREVRAAALGLRGDLYGVNVSSLYKVLYNYTLGAGHQADAEAQKIAKQERLDALHSSALGAALDAGAGALVRNINARTK